MGTIRVKKTVLADAIQINSPEDERIVLQWLEEMTGNPSEGAYLDDLKESGAYLLRDDGDKLIYVMSKAHFEKNYERVDDPFTFTS